MTKEQIKTLNEALDKSINDGVKEIRKNAYNTKRTIKNKK